jgi:hypothetical protein
VKKKLIFTLIIIGMTFLSVCLSEEELNYLPNGNSNKTEMHIELFNVDDDGTRQKVNFDSISGYVMVVLRNIPTDVDKVFVYFDEVQIGNWISGGVFSDKWFGFESNRFSNGRHKMKLVSINSAGEIKNYPPINGYFKNLIYNVRGNEYFHPTEDYHYSGFYDGGKPLEVKLTNYNGDDVIWSNIYSGNYIDINIPGSVFGTEQLCKLNITDSSCSTTGRLFKKFRKEDFGGININEEQVCTKEAESSVPDINETVARPVATPQQKRELTEVRQAGTSIEFFQADKYFAPPSDKTVAILLYPAYAEINGYRPTILFGDKKIAEKLMGKPLEPEEIIEGREWLDKIMKAYNTALNEAKEKNLYRNHHDIMGQIIFVTAKKGYIRAIDVDAYNVYDDYMESSKLKAYFYELGLTEKPLPGKPPKEFKSVLADTYFVPSADETTAILIFNDFYNPEVLIGDKEKAEKIMGEYIRPKKIFKDRNLLEKIMDAYGNALKEAEERHFESGGDGSWRILFITPAGGFSRTIGIDEEVVYDNHMESGPLKKLFDESGLTDELLAGGPNAVP